MFSLKVKHLLWVLICSSFTCMSYGEAATLSKKQFSTKVDQIFSFLDESDAPGCAVGVIEEGRFLHKSAYGMANLELDVPLSTDSVFRIASISKQFTAALDEFSPKSSGLIIADTTQLCRNRLLGRSPGPHALAENSCLWRYRRSLPDCMAICRQLLSAPVRDNQVAASGGSMTHQRSSYPWHGCENME